MTPSAKTQRYARIVKWVSVLLIVVAVMLMMRTLPIKQIVAALDGWIGSLGVSGPVVYAAIYAVATVLMVPGSALTLGAGVIFGLGTGTITVSIGSTVGAALALLVGRYLARKRVERMAADSPKFAAMDKAIGQRGWTIVALFRLSPAVPFNLQNYLYGLTSIRFWPCVLTSWVCMLPGTFLYVYLGYAGGEAAKAATGAGSGASIGKYALMIVGFIATVVVTVYVTRIAVKALKQSTDIDQTASAGMRTEGADMPESTTPQGWPASATVIALMAIIMLAAAAYAQANRQKLTILFGPPPARLAESYEAKSDGPAFDHSAFDALVKKHVDGHGWVKYAGFAKDAQQLGAYINSLETAPFEQMGRDQKLAFLINAYNAFTVQLILDYWNGGKLESIKDIPAKKRWDHVRWNVAGNTWSLSQIEHEQIRNHFNEPRIHFALVCAASSCPKLRNEAYDAKRLDKQLEDQTVYSHVHDRWYRYEARGNIAHITALYDWYGDDFEKKAGTILAFVAHYRPEIVQALQTGNAPEIKHLDYSWKLNDVRNMPK